MSNQREQLDGTGCPYKLRGEDLQCEDRLLMILDMYQALTEERPYRGRAFDHRETMELLNREAARGKVDARLVSDLEQMLEA